MRYAAYIAILSLAVGGTPALAQQGDGQGMQGHGQAQMDMQTMAKECAAARRQVQQNPSVSRSPDMKKKIAQCDQMDRMMGGHQGSPGMGGQTK